MWDGYAEVEMLEGPISSNRKEEFILIRMQPRPNKKLDKVICGSGLLALKSK